MKNLIIRHPAMKVSTSKTHLKFKENVHCTLSNHDFIQILQYWEGYKEKPGECTRVLSKAISGFEKRVLKLESIWNVDKAKFFGLQLIILFSLSSWLLSSYSGKKIGEWKKILTQKIWLYMKKQMLTTNPGLGTDF